jgi:hypothetical protein
MYSVSAPGPQSGNLFISQTNGRLSCIGYRLRAKETHFIIQQIVDFLEENPKLSPVFEETLIQWQNRLFTGSWKALLQRYGKLKFSWQDLMPTALAISATVHVLHFDSIGELIEKFKRGDFTRPAGEFENLGCIILGRVSSPSEAPSRQLFVEITSIDVIPNN